MRGVDCDVAYLGSRTETCRLLLIFLYSLGRVEALARISHPVREQQKQEQYP